MLAIRTISVACESCLLACACPIHLTMLSSRVQLSLAVLDPNCFEAALAIVVCLPGRTVLNSEGSDLTCGTCLSAISMHFAY